MKPILWAVAAIFAVSVQAFASPFPGGHTPDSDIWIDYSDLNFVLKSAVLDMGPSTHERAGRVQKDIMTRTYGGNQKATRFEGNRVAFHEFKKEHRRTLKAIRNDLLSVPAQISLEELSRDQQLAYFLNLHTSIVLVKIAREYPVTQLEDFFDRSEPTSYINKRQFPIGGRKVSLADIQDHVLANWHDPLVIYGFYFGAIGTPNIRDEAYDANKVHDQLRANALDFVNSVRGTQVWSGSELRIATYYERMSEKFPSFEQDVMQHIRQYARPDFLDKLNAVRSMEVRINDWNIADLFNGNLHQAGQTSARVAVDANGRLVGQWALPLHVQQALAGRARNFRKFGGEVEVEEVDDN